MLAVNNGGQIKLKYPLNYLTLCIHLLYNMYVKMVQYTVGSL